MKINADFLDVDFIKPLQGINNIQPVATDGPSFSEFLVSAVENANNADALDAESAEQLLAGEVNDLHTVGLAAERADLALQLTIQIRNKVLDAYNEVMRMQV